MTSFFKGNTLYRQDSNDNYLKVNDIIPVNHWKLQEASGTDVNDGGSNPETLTNSNATVNQTGKISKAYDFNGTTARLATSNVRTDAVGSYSAWIYREGDGSFQSLYSSCRTNSNTYSFNIAITTDNKFALFIRENTVLSYLTTTNTVTQNTWVHLAVTSDGSTSKLYINGVEETVIVVAGSNNGSWLGDVTSRVNTNIGRTERQDITDYFDGSMEDVRLYDYPLSEQEIATIYNAGNGTLSNSLLKVYPTVAEPIHHWKLQEESGTDVNDSMNNSILTNINATVNQAGKIGKCYDFDGSGQRLRSTYTPAGTEGTLCFWANIDAFDSGAIITSSDESTTDYYWSIRFVPSNIIQILAREGVSSYAAEGTTSLSTGVWYHFAVVSLDDSYKVYINGTEETLTGDNDGKWFGDISNRDNFVIGAFQRTSVSGGFDGRAEDVRLYDYALSEQEIKNLYNNGKGLLL